MSAPRTQTADQAAAWADAIAYMREHGDQWSIRALERLQSLIQRQDLLGSEEWVKVIDKMIELADAPRQ